MPMDWLTVGEAARIAEVSGETIRLWTGAGKLKAVRTPSGVRLIRRRDLDRYLAHRKLERGDVRRESA